MLPYINYYKEVYNVGDRFSEYILNKIYDITKLDKIDNRKTIRFIGSEIPTPGWMNKNTLCCGMGWRVRSAKLDINTVSKDNFLYTRGKISKQRIIDAGLDIDKNMPVGDSGLLASLLFKTNKIKKYDICILTHFTDAKNIGTYKSYIQKIYGSNLSIICYSMGDKNIDCEYLFNVISQSKIVLSTSLHGIIFAHSFGTKALYMNCYNGQRYVDSYKFEDYYSVYDRIKYDLSPEKNNYTDVIKKIYDNNYLESVNPTRDEVAKIQNNIINAFPYKEAFSTFGKSLLEKKIAIVAIARLENNYINEWINYHLGLGFNHIYIYDNSCGDETHIDTVIPLELKNKVTIIPAYNKIAYQKESYNDAYEKFSNLYDFLMYIDIDEFLVLKKHNTIQEYLNFVTYKTPDVENIKINWEIYDDNDIIERDITIPVMKSFTRKGTTKLCIAHNNAVKSIVKCGIKGLFFNHVHYPWINNRNLVVTNGEGDRIKFIKWQMVKPRVVETACINHYLTKSISEYMIQKLKRGDADGYKIRSLDNDFFEYSHKTSEKVEYYNKHIKYDK